MDMSLLRNQQQSDPERRLWLFVIRQAQMEAQGRYDGNAKLKPQARRHAIRWLSVPSDELYFVCHQAGLTLDEFHKLIEDAKRGVFGVTWKGNTWQ